MADTDPVALGNTSLAWITADGELCIRVGDKVATLDADQRQQLARLLATAHSQRQCEHGVLLAAPCEACHRWP